MQGAERQEEGFLKEVFSSIGATSIQVEARKQQPRRAANQFLKCGTIAATGTRNQGYVGLAHATSAHKDAI
jgi:hypothetical protein